VLAQEVRDLVRALVELPVGESPSLEDNGDRVWVALHLLLEQLVHAHIRKLHTRVIPSVQNLV
jgi:hypothetical protein